MLEKFKTYCQVNNLFKKSDKILIAISGGIDSTALLHLFLAINQPIGLAHCNFHLRGKESDDDETFVRHLAQKHNIPLFVTHFDTSNYAQTHGMSIQMAARELRYQWFEKIRQENNFSKIAIAHNKNDVVETMLINLSRGSGLKGLSSIKAKSGHIVRPLLFAERQEIIDYASKEKIDYREDSSNASTKYTRNFIRHKIIPLFENLNPSFLSSAIRSTQHLNEVLSFMEDTIKALEQNIVNKLKDNTIEVSIKSIKDSPHYALFLHYLLEKYGFNGTQTHDISTTTTSGKQFTSAHYRLIVNRDALLISRKTKKEILTPTRISANDQQTDSPIALKFRKIKKTDDFKIPTNNNIATLDFDKLSFPLIIRPWQHGDYFYPLGMNKRKKISDFFIDEKYALSEKENALLLTTNDNQVVWIIGKRLDNRYKITSGTKHIFEISIQ
jgi:tRNA(Ile)-lysidine synthase